MKVNKDIMISVSIPYSRMLQYGKKTVIYCKQHIKSIRNMDRLWFYETKHRGGSGKVIGSAVVEAVIPMKLINAKKETIKEIYAADKKLYLYYAVDLLGGFDLWITEDYLLDIMLKMREHYYQHLKYQSDPDAENENYAILFNDFSNVSLELNNFISQKTKNELIVSPKKICFISMKKVER